MAGDWIKMRVDLVDDPAVIGMASELALEEDLIVGKLHRLWSWADRQTTDGHAQSVSEAWLDRYMNVLGFAKALETRGWLLIENDGISFPNFNRHNGISAKKRAEATNRKRMSRKKCDKNETGTRTKSVPRPLARAIMVRDDYRCVYCGDQSDAYNEASRKGFLSIDHVVPSSRGGTTSEENLVVSCIECNMQKSNRTPEEWGMSLAFLQKGVTYESQKIRDHNVTREEKRREEKKEDKTPPSPPLGGTGPIEFPETLRTDDFKASWSEWIEYRRERLLPPYKPRGLKGALSRLAGMGAVRASQAIRWSICQNYQGIHEEQNNGTGTKNNRANVGNRPLTRVDAPPGKYDGLEKIRHVRAKGRETSPPDREGSGDDR